MSSVIVEIDIDQSIPKVVQAIKERCENAKKIVLISTQIDPDAIGAMSLMRLLLVSFFNHDSSKIVEYYGGPVADAENRTIFTHFQLQNTFQPVPDVLKKGDDEVWILLDSNSINDRRVSIDLSGVDVVIDHHIEDKVSKEGNRIFLVERVGATCTLVMEMLASLVGEFSQLKKLDQEALTLGAIGLFNDTNGLRNESTTERDINAFYLLRRLASTADVCKVAQYPLTMRDLKILSQILNSCSIVGSCIISSAGYVNEVDADNLARGASLLLRLSQVTLAVVWGIIAEKRLVVVKARSYNPTTNISGMLKAAFGDARGGGKQSASYGEGGATLDLSSLGEVISEEDYRASLGKVVDQQIRARILGQFKED